MAEHAMVLCIHTNDSLEHTDGIHISSPPSLPLIYTATDWSFKVDQVLHNTPQEDVYSACAQEITTKLMDGFNGTILAYGETGSGKTHTMTGPIENYRLRGIIPRVISQVSLNINHTEAI